MATGKSYSFSRHFDDAWCDYEQVIWQIEDELNLKLMRYSIGEHVEGSSDGTTSFDHLDLSITFYTEVDDLEYRDGLRTRTLTSGEEEALGEIVGRHCSRPREWRGNYADVVLHYAPSVGRIVVRANVTGDEKFASGFLFGTRTRLVTAAHVVDPDVVTLEFVEFGDHRVSAQIDRLDRRTDVAILTLDEPVAGSPLRTREQGRPSGWGSPCLVVGFPNIPGMEPTPPSIYELQLTSLKRNYLIGEVLLELSTHLGAGFSGSPVLDDRHSLLGVVVAFPEEHDPQEVQEPGGPIWPRWTPVAIGADAITRLLEKP